MNNVGNYMPPVVIFSIDDQSVYGLMKFYRRASELEAMQKLEGKIVPCIGMYEGVFEFSWIATEEDFLEHFDDLASGQKTLLKVTTDSGGRMFAKLVNYRDHSEIRKGRLVEVDPETAIKGAAFTYRLDLDKYWVMI